MITFASSRDRNHSIDRHSSRSLPLKDSSVPFCQGLPGSLVAVLMPEVTIQARIARETNSGPFRQQCGLLRGYRGVP